MMQRIKAILHDLSHAKDALKSRAIQASFWGLLFYGFDILIRICSSVILTRLLFPEAYGLMAVAYIIPTIITLWSDVGLRASIIRHRDGHLQDYLATAWAIQALRGVGICLLIIVCSLIFHKIQLIDLFPSSSIFNNPLLPWLIIVVSISSIFNGLESAKVHLAYRELQLRYITMIEITSKLIGFLVMLLMCLITRSVWVLAAGSLSIDFTRMILSHLFLKGPAFRLVWDKNYAADIFTSGKWIAISSFFSLVTLQGDRVLLGIFFPASIVGIYSIALQIISTLQGFLDHNIRNIVPTVFGETFKTDPNAMKPRYYKMRIPLDGIAFFFVGILWIAGPSIVAFLYDARYQDAGWMLQWLALWLFVMPFETIQHAFPVIGKSHIYAYVSMVQAFSLITLGLFGYFVAGLPGMIAGIGGYRIISSVLTIIAAHQMDFVSFRRELSQLKMLIIGLLSGLVITVILTFIKR